MFVAFRSFRYFLIGIILITGCSSAWAQTVVNLTTGSGNWTVPCNVSSIQVECWGGGGQGGGDGNTSPSISGSGGGGGGYCTTTMAVTPGQTIAYAVGAGGAGAGNGAVGMPGTNTSFSTVIANGGGGGAIGNGPGGSGGGGSGGTVVVGATGQTGNVTPNWSGAGGLAGNMVSGNGLGRNSDGNGLLGTVNMGGGGGGAQHTAASPNSGGSGGSGLIKITYTQTALNGTYTIGPGGNFASITASITALQCLPITGPVLFELLSGYTSAAEPSFPLNFGAIPGASAVNTVTYRPAAGVTGLVTEGVPASSSSLIIFSGTNYVTFDGRPGGAGTSREWTIRNARTAVTVGNTVSFLSDASNNKLTYLNIEGEASANNAVILFGAAGAGGGNDNNTISYCTVRDLTALGTGVFPCTGIYSAGTAGQTNSGNTIDNNYFTDIFNPAGNISGGIEVASNNDNWVITNNHFFQGGGSYIDLITNPWTGIFINGGGGHTISGNYVGGKAPFCGGGAFTVTTGTSQFQGIRFGAGSVGAACTVTGNTVANIAYTTTSTTAGIWMIVGYGLNGSADITFGTAGNGNTFGSMTGTGSIILTNNGASGSIGITGIYHNMLGTCTIAYNNFGGITVQGTRSGAESEMIYFGANTGSVTITNNVFGGAVANSINIISDSPFYGINNAGNSSGMVVSNNTLQYISHNAVTAAFGGIYNISGAITVTGNTIQNIIGTANANYNMIYHVPSAGANATLSSNTIQKITLSNPGNTALFYGIRITSTSNVACNGNTIGGTLAKNILVAGNAKSNGILKAGTGTLSCSNNIIQQFDMTSTGATALFRGIECSAGALIASNNIIQDNAIAANAATLLVNIGILSNSTSTGHTISQNTVQNLHAMSTAATSMGVAGIYVSSASSSGTISRNFVTGLTNRTTPGNSDITGIQITGGTWTAVNNVVMLDNAPNTNNLIIFGLEENEATSTTTCYHNTVKIGGVIAAGTANSYAFYRGGIGTDNIRNNVFYNDRTGGSGGHYAEYAVSGGTYITNYNYLESVATPARIGHLGAADYDFVNWKGITGANKDQTGTIAMDGIGKVTTVPFPGAGAGINLITLVPQDKLALTRGLAPWMGAYEGININTGPFGPQTVCTGANIQVPFTVLHGPFTGGNIFTAELSDAAGDFSVPVSIGTLASTTSGTINATIPVAQTPGAGYRIRVIASNPSATGSDNQYDINIINGVAPGNTIPHTEGFESCMDWTIANATVNQWVQGSATNNGGTKAMYISTDGGTSNTYSLTISAISHLYKTFVFGPAQVCVSFGFDQRTYGETSFDNLSVYIGAEALPVPGAGVSPASLGYTLIGGPYFSAAAPGYIPQLISLSGYQGTNQRIVFTWKNDGSLGNQPPAAIDNISLTAIVTAPTTYTVTNTNDAGAGSLRQAITDANLNCGHDLIKFDLGAGGPFTINLATQLPALTDNSGVTIDGWDNSGNNGTPNSVPVFNATPGTPLNPVYKVILGNPGSNVLTGLVINSSNNIVKGLVFSNFGTIATIDGTAIEINGNNNQVLGCYLGMNENGITQGGTNSDFGVEIFGANNSIGNGTAAGANLISGLNSLGGDGIKLSTGTATGNLIKGNMIGLQKDGTNVVAGSVQGDGIYVVTGAAGNIIGGTVAGEGNVISGNDTYGGVFLSSGNSNQVLGNIIGPAADGISHVAGNIQQYGIQFGNAGSNSIGSNNPSGRNIISGNTLAGIYFSGTVPSGNTIKGNYIGPTASLGNMAGSSQDYGLSLTSGASANTIGSTVAGEENIVAFNTSTGVRLFNATTVNNRISGNSIYSNPTKAIDLNYGANQGNNGKAVPTITTVLTTTVVGTSGANNTVEVFKNTTGNAQDAAVYVGTATANGSGNWSLGVTLVAGDYVLATATDATNNTSEFSPPVAVQSNTIATDAIGTSLLCRGGSISVTYSVTGTFNPGNIFTAQLSNEFGSFAAPTSIGNVTAIVATPITATIPVASTPGTLYRIRVVSSNPVVIGTNNGTDLTIPLDGGAGTWTWQGTASSDWFNRCNWDKRSLPDASSFVTVPSGTPNNPYISGAHAACKRITIQSTTGARVQINSTGGWKLNITP